jgi:hypothetical protein
MSAGAGYLEGTQQSMSLGAEAVGAWLYEPPPGVVVQRDQASFVDSLDDEIMHAVVPFELCRDRLDRRATFPRR